jgi:hypothetical protein
LSTIFVEEDDTQHQVLVFDHQTVGYSGFMGCVTHSLALTDQSLFDVGREPVISISVLAVVSAPPTRVIRLERKSWVC